MLKHYAGISPEELSLLDAYADGSRAGVLGLSAGLNPYQCTELEFAEWERGRRQAMGAWLANFAEAR